MISKEYLRTGQLNEAFDSLTRAIGQFKRNYSKGKVGITGREPEMRYQEHKNNGVRFTMMHVLYSSGSENYVKQLEAWLIERHGDWLSNVASGGEGNLTKPGKFYLYILL